MKVQTQLEIQGHRFYVEYDATYTPSTYNEPPEGSCRVEFIDCLDNVAYDAYPHTEVVEDACWEDFRLNQM